MAKVKTNGLKQLTDSMGKKKKAQIPVCKVSSYISVDDLKFHPKNAELRTCSRERLDDFKASILKKGFYEPILVWSEDNVVLAGEHRVRAARELIAEGHEFVTVKGVTNLLPVVIQECDEARAFQILVESNSHYASWIEEKLNSAMQEAHEAGQDLKAFGYSDEQVDEILASAVKDAEESLDESDENTDDESETKTKGDAQDEYETLTLPKDTHENLMDVLGEIAQAINPYWNEGDSVVEAVDALCQLIKESGVLKHLSEQDLDVVPSAEGEKTETNA